MKILLADDEKLIRTSLRSMLEEIDFTFHTIEEAANGTEIVGKLNTFQPDIAFVDIQMPGLTGLEAIKIGKTLSPTTQWIILTGFSEFKYAKEAIELGAVGYLLKPASTDELLETLNKTVIHFREILRNLNSEFENEMNSFFHGLKTFSEITPMFKLSSYHNSVFFIDSKLDEKEKTNRLTLFCNDLQKIIDQYQTRATRTAMFALSNRELAFISTWGLDENDEGEQPVNSLMQKVEAILPKYCDNHFSISLITNCPSKLGEFKNNILEIREVSSLRIVSGVKRKLDLSQLQQLKRQKQVYQLCTLLSKLSENHNEKNSLSYMKVLDDLEKMLTSLVTYKDNIREFLSCVLPCQLNPNSPIDEWIANLKTCGENLLKNHNKEEDRSQFLVDQVLVYVDEHYMDDIGIGQIAQELQVTPNYLSTLFHKKIGTTFIKYLSKIRILKAKELLADPRNQVQKVAEAVGYYSTRHFTKLFTEIIGCYPSEYQKKFRNEKTKI